MKKLIFTVGALLMYFGMDAQIIVNKVDVTQETETFDVWAFKKPLSVKESFFMDYGQDDFKPHYYDHKSQSINDKDGNKFEKGEWIKLVKFLNANGYEEKSTRDAEIGDQKGRVVTFIKKKI